MSSVSFGSREEKEKWLLRPVSIAGHIAWFSAFFGFVYYYMGAYDDRTIIYMLVAALGITSGLLIWGIARIQNVIRGRL